PVPVTQGTLFFQGIRMVSHSSGMADGEPTPYQVDLEVFRGPLDLLLYLVKRDEVDILDIPIARVCEQFLAYLNGGRFIDVEGASDFLVMASTLTEIKSKFV